MATTRRTLRLPWTFVEDGKVQENLMFLTRRVGDIQSRIFWGDGSPETVVEAPIGAIYLRRDGTPLRTLYVKEDGANTADGWSRVTTADASTDP